jgi:hypothetical protein
MIDVSSIRPDDTDRAFDWFVQEWKRTGGKVDPSRAESVIGALADPTDYLARVEKFLDSK